MHVLNRDVNLIQTKQTNPWVLPSWKKENNMEAAKHASHTVKCWIRYFFTVTKNSVMKSVKIVTIICNCWSQLRITHSLTHLLTHSLTHLLTQGRALKLCIIHDIVGKILTKSITIVLVLGLNLNWNFQYLILISLALFYGQTFSDFLLLLVVVSVCSCAYICPWCLAV